MPSSTSFRAETSLVGSPPDSALHATIGKLPLWPPLKRGQLENIPGYYRAAPGSIEAVSTVAPRITVLRICARTIEEIALGYDYGSTMSHLKTCGHLRLCACSVTILRLKLIYRKAIKLVLLEKITVFTCKVEPASVSYPTCFRF